MRNTKKTLLEQFLLHTTEQSRLLDTQATLDGVDESELMENAARACLAVFRKNWPISLGSVLVICGPGNNGGDGFVLARLLKEAGYTVVVCFSDAATAMAYNIQRGQHSDQGKKESFGRRVKEDSHDPLVRQPVRFDALESWVNLQETEDIPVYSFGMEDDCAVVVDAIFGAGLSRPVKGVVAQIATQISSGRCLVMSIDLPSGLCGDTGRVLGTAFTADVTVTFTRPKLGHYLGCGPERCGHLYVREIGIPQNTFDILNGEEIAVMNVPQVWSQIYKRDGLRSHKYSYGHVLVCSGPANRTGAARMAAYAALRSGAGLVTIAAPTEAMQEIACQVTSVMLQEVGSTDKFTSILEDDRINCVVIGPAFGYKKRLGEFIKSVTGSRQYKNATRSIVLDADALTFFRQDPQILFSDISGGRCILTPHIGEFVALFPDLAEEMAGKTKEIRGSNRESQELIPTVPLVREAAKRAGCVVLLKGAATIIADPDDRCAVINLSVGRRAAPWLATAGSGDVLAGIVAGLLAQGYTPRNAASMATWLHTESARMFGVGMIAEDLLNGIPSALKRLYKDKTPHSSLV